MFCDIKHSRHGFRIAAGHLNDDNPRPQDMSFVIGENLAHMSSSQAGDASILASWDI